MTLDAKNSIHMFSVVKPSESQTLAGLAISGEPVDGDNRGAFLARLYVNRMAF
jgi:hypothetical protein